MMAPTVFFPDSKRQRLSSSSSAVSSSDGEGEGATRLQQLVDSVEPDDVEQLLRLLLHSGKTSLAQLVGSVQNLVTEDAKRHNARGWAALPVELLSTVFALLPDMKDLRACSETCAAWNSVVWSSAAELPTTFGGYDVPKVVAKCPRLEVFNCSCNWIRDTTFGALSQLPRLTTLHLTKVENAPELLAAGGAVHSGLTGLTELRLCLSRPDQSLDLAHFSALRSLGLSFPSKGFNEFKIKKLRPNNVVELASLPPALGHLSLARLALDVRYGKCTEECDIDGCMCDALSLRRSCLTRLDVSYASPGDSGEWGGLSRDLTGLRHLSLHLDKPERDLEGLSRLHQLACFELESTGGGASRPFACPPSLTKISARLETIKLIENLPELVSLRVLGTLVWGDPLHEQLGILDGITTLTHVYLTGWNHDTPRSSDEWAVVASLPNLVVLKLGRALAKHFEAATAYFRSRRPAVHVIADHSY
eukprot:TRINITY_DN2855_c0_g1_i1.p1 TRINITY_DN2855_c0_g1~~TRINITY_DN2855_c0_g1_i1.p1  ORF type:complete len:476 (-),score=77.70 TRINITY_DN2855_c0_g1_i1:70-1497(-)